MTRLDVSEISVVRGGRAIVDGVTMEAEAGQFVGLIGANGAGKSTLLSVLAGLLAPERGTVLLDGKALPAIERRALARSRAYLPQSPRAEWPVSVERLVALGLTPQLPAFGGLPAAMQARVTDMVAMFDLAGQADQPATTLSGGEAQRIKIAAHLSSHAGERLLYILDEPTTGLHFDDIAKLLAAFRKLLEAGHTLVVIEHNLDVIKVADWIIDLGPEGGEDGGRVLAMATPEQVAHVAESHTGKYIREVLSSGKLLQTVGR